jgi:hypothetical protein
MAPTAVGGYALPVSPAAPPIAQHQLVRAKPFDHSPAMQIANLRPLALRK